MTSCYTQQSPNTGNSFVLSAANLGDASIDDLDDLDERFDLDEAFAESGPKRDTPEPAIAAVSAVGPLHKHHRQDLERSGLSAEMIAAMGCQSATGTSIHQCVYKNEDEYLTGTWGKAGGYVIPYIDRDGQVVARRWRMFWHEQDKKMPKYLSVRDADTHLYVPAGFDAVYSATDYLIITEGEKKAAKAVQEGFPCVAIAGVDMWADSAARRAEKANHRSMSPATPLIKRLAELAGGRKCLVLFDSDAREKMQVRGARRRLKDALLYQVADWVREMDLPMPEGADTGKMGLDDLLVHTGGKALLESTIAAALKIPGQSLAPLFRLPYDEFEGKPLYYYVPNLAPRDSFGRSVIYKDIVVEAEDGARRVCSKEICTTRVWLSRVIHSADDDGDTLYELSYIPHTKRSPERLVGGYEILRLSQGKDDLLGRKGALVEAKYRSQLETFFIDAQKYGPAENIVRTTQGTRLRGWRDVGGVLAYVMASRVVTADAVTTDDDPNASLIPIHSGSDDILRQALTVAGDAQLWKRIIINHVLDAPVAMMVFAAGLAGMLRYWCASSENFILHLYGASSGGKTTLLEVAASAWGKPKSLIDTWRGTSNGIERKAVGRNDMCMILDEAGMADEQCLVEAIYSLGNGAEKIRATRDVGERKATKFRVVALSTGEKQLVRGQKFAGQEVRAIELRADQYGPLMPTIRCAEDAEALSRALNNNYGHAVEPMIRGILSLVEGDRLAIQTIWEKRTEDIRSQIDKTVPPHVMRRVKHFGLCLTAIGLFQKFVLEYDDDVVEDHLRRMTRMVVKQMVQLDTDQFSQGETIGILQHFMDQLAACQAKFVNTNRPQSVGLPSDLYGSIEGTVCFVIPGKLAEMMRPYDNARTVQAIESIDALMTRNAGKKKKISHRIGGARPDCYVFDLGKIEAVIYKDD